MSGWTDELVEKASQLWKEGLSGAQIADALNSGHSRNAVLGKLDRIGLLGTRPPEVGHLNNRMRSPRSAPRIAKPRPKHKPRKPRLVLAGNGTVMSVTDAPPPRVKIPENKFSPLEGSEPKVWTERAFNECAWPVGGEGADTLSCCLPIAGKSWCATHLAMGTDHKSTLASRSAKELVRSLRRFAA